MDESISTLAAPVEGITSRPDRPKLLFMGPRSGESLRFAKWSFTRLDGLLSQMEPDRTLHLGSTRGPMQDDVSSYIEMEIHDLPGQLDSEAFSMPLASVGAVIFVIDSQSQYFTIIQSLGLAIYKAHEINPNLQFEVFIHKIDSFNGDQRQDILNEIKLGLTDEIADLEAQNYDGNLDSPFRPGDLANRIQYRLTSIFDYSIFEALSRVIMKLIPQQDALENLMNLHAQQSGIEKCFLFDDWSKLYIATDSSPVDHRTLELCSGFLDLFVDFAGLYGVIPSLSPVTPVNRPSATHSQPQPGRQSRSRSQPNTSPLRMSVYGKAKAKEPEEKREEPREAVTQRMVTSHVRLDSAMGGPDKVISYYQVNEYLSLVCVARQEVMDEQSGLIEYNVAHLRESVIRILDLNAKRRRMSEAGADTG